jgi:hypothetical protein
VAPAAAAVTMRVRVIRVIRFTAFNVGRVTVLDKKVDGKISDK